MKRISLYFLIIFFISYFVSCKSDFINEIVDFQVNRAPVIISFTSDQPYSTELSAGQSFNITVIASDPDSDELIFNYLGDTGVFSGQAESKSGDTYISTVNFVLPNTLPAGVAARITVEITDPKKAMSVQSLDLGNAHIGLLVSIISTSPLNILPNNDITLRWIADGDGFYQVKLTSDTGTCEINEELGFAPFYANEEEDIIVCGASSLTPVGLCDDKFTALNEQKKLCIMVRDNLLQDTLLIQTLTSDNTPPTASITPEINNGTFPFAKTVLISCNDNFLCAQISYALGTAGSVSDPNFTGSGTVIDGNNLSLVVGDQGSQDYELKYIVHDATGNTSALHTDFFTIDPDAPLVSLVSNQYSTLSINGNTATTIQWSGNKTGNYQLKTGNDCTTGTNITGGSNLSGYYSSPNSTVTATVNASGLSSGVNNVKICLTADNLITSFYGLSITRDDTIPSVYSVLPDEGDSSVPVDSTITVTFNKSVNPDTVTTNFDGSCSGSLQVSSDNFATCLPMASFPAYDASHKVFTLDPVVLYGLTSYKIRATNAIKDPYGNSLTAFTSSSGFTTINDPGVISLSSSSPNGIYSQGSDISIEIQFTSPVVVSGTPALLLNSGGTAYYSSGTGTNQLTFIYTVGSGESTDDLDYSSASSLSVGNFIKNTSGADANLTLPAPGSEKSISYSKIIQVDGVNDSDVISVTSPTNNGSYHLYDQIYVEIIFRTNANVTNTPYLNLNTSANSYYNSGTGTTTLTFLYTVGAKQQTSDLDYSSTTALVLSSGTITNDQGNDLRLTLPAPGGSQSLAWAKDISVNSYPTFVDLGNGIIQDTNNRLEWTKCPNGQSGTGCSGTATTSGIQTAINYCSSLDLNGTGWVVSSHVEFLTIYDTSYPGNNNADPAFFPNMPPAIYTNYIFFWASNSVWASGFTRIFNFYDAGTPTWCNSCSAYVRCFRQY